jgi:hypothetical protein
MQDVIFNGSANDLKPESLIEFRRIGGRRYGA